MKLATTDFSVMLGGQAEIEKLNPQEFLQRGEISGIQILDDNQTLCIRFLWGAYCDTRYPKWRICDLPDLNINLAECDVVEEDDYFWLFDTKTGDEIHLFFPGGRNRLDPAEVEGL